MSLHTEVGREALAAAMAEKDPSSLAAATRLRKAFPPELAAEALGQAVLRRKARTKFGEAADEMFFTADALEQATRPVVSRWRAERLKQAGITRVVDLGCGIGADSLACLEIGLEVVAVELDEVTAWHAAANLGAGEPLDKLGHRGAVDFGGRGVGLGDRGTVAEPVEAMGRAAAIGTTVAEPVEALRAVVIHGDAVALAPELLADAGAETCVFIDPARRTDRGRTWNVDAFTPPWSFVLDLLAGDHSTVVKLGPGVPKQILPDHVEALWVADGHDVVECSLWSTPDARDVHAAVLLPAGLRLERTGEQLPTGPVGEYLVEPHGAVIRAGALEGIADGLWLLDEHIAYLGSHEPLASPHGTCFEVLDVLDANPKVLKAWVREHRVGTLEIKKRGIDVDPAELRKKLQPKGPNSATLLLARTQDGTRALVVRRVPSPGVQQSGGQAR